ncbi:hypothetical protein TNCV_4776991 [Trichonephila clavipes]|nr:hypothetical protein TNCV_4776991 [Trichonephila clavipes]
MARQKTSDKNRARSKKKERSRDSDEDRRHRRRERRSNERRVYEKVKKVAAIRDISRSYLDPNDFTVLNCIVKGHASLSPPSLRLRLCSRFTLLAA